MGLPIKAFIQMSASVAAVPELEVDCDSLVHKQTGEQYVPVITFMSMETGELCQNIDFIEVLDYEITSLTKYDY